MSLVPLRARSPKGRAHELGKGRAAALVSLTLNMLSCVGHARHAAQDARSVKQQPITGNKTDCLPETCCTSAFQVHRGQAPDGDHCRVGRHHRQ